MTIRQIFESETITLRPINTNIDIDNPCYSNQNMGFVHQLLSLAGYDPMSLSSVFAATQRITNGIGMLPWEIKTYDDIEIPDSHYLYHLFDHCIQTPFIFMKNLVKDVITHGNGFAYIERDEAGKPINLVYLPAGTCTVEHDSTNLHVWYRVPLLNAGARIEPINIIHIFMDSADGIQGKSLLSFANKAIRLASYTEKASIDYFGKGMRLTGVLSTNAPRLTDKQRQEIRDAYLAGTTQEGGIAVLEAGMQFSQMSNSARDSQLIDARLYNVQEIARYFNLSPTLLGDLSHNQYNSIESANLDFTSNTLGPWITILEQELNRKLVLPSDKKKLYIDLDEDALIKSDRQSFANYLSILISKGLISINEGRRLLGFKSIGEEGDKFVLPYSGQIDTDGNIDAGYNKKDPDKNNDNKEDEER